MAIMLERNFTVEEFAQQVILSSAAKPNNITKIVCGINGKSVDISVQNHRIKQLRIAGQEIQVPVAMQPGNLKRYIQDTLNKTINHHSLFHVEPY